MNIRKVYKKTYDVKRVIYFLFFVPFIFSAQAFCVVDADTKKLKEEMQKGPKPKSYKMLGYIKQNVEPKKEKKKLIVMGLYLVEDDDGNEE